MKKAPNSTVSIVLLPVIVFTDNYLQNPKEVRTEVHTTYFGMYV